jgi:hypothetical protein
MQGYEPTRKAVMAFVQSGDGSRPMAKATTKLTAQERVILFCTATGISHTAVGITAHAMQSMAVRGFITHNRETGVYGLTDSGRAALMEILANAGLK